MAKFVIDLEGFAHYTINAESEQDAVTLALEWWREVMPNIQIKREN